MTVQGLIDKLETMNKDALVYREYDLDEDIAILVLDVRENVLEGTTPTVKISQLTIWEWFKCIKTTAD